MASKAGEGSAGKSGSTRKKGKICPKYIKAWESEPDFKGWLMPSSKGQLLGFCSACNVHISLICGKMEVRKHAAGKKHRENCTAVAK